MHVLILGGSPNHPGGLEAFCERATGALAGRGEWRVGVLPTDTAFLTPRRVPAFLRGLSRLVRYRRHRPDCVWLQYVNLPDLAYLALAKLLGLRVVVTPHLGSAWRSQSQPVLRSISQRLLGLADRFALLSKTQELEIALPRGVPRSLIRTFLPAAALAVPPAPDSPAESLQLLHSSRLSEGKGTFLFVEVCERLRDAGVLFQARIAGGADDETLARLHGMIDAKRLGDVVSVLGRLSTGELVALMRTSDVLVHLSRVDSYPLIVLEALACEMLPVCLELAGARDMVQSYDGYVVGSERPADDAAELLRGLGIAEARLRARAAGARVRADYEWDRCVAVLEAALDARPSGG
jgi:glycosyltransferase involved in cell wall biosynthesis